MARSAAVRCAVIARLLVRWGFAVAAGRCGYLTNLNTTSSDILVLAQWCMTGIAGSELWSG